jgi:hypothetical protein
VACTQVNYDGELGKGEREQRERYILRIGEMGREQTWREKMAWVPKEVSVG